MFQNSQKNQSVLSQYLISENSTPETRWIRIKKMFQTLKEKYQNLSTTIKISIFICIAILVLAALRPSKQTLPLTPTRFTPVLLTLVPINKGEMLDANFLQQIEVHQKELSPKQRIDRLTVEQIEKFSNYRIKAKRNLPPHKIIFWSDLEFLSPRGQTQNNKGVQIIFSDTKDIQ